MSDDTKTKPVEKYGQMSQVGRRALDDIGREVVTRLLGEHVVAQAQDAGYVVVGEPTVRFHDRLDAPFLIEGQDPDMLDVMTTVRVFRP